MFKKIAKFIDKIFDEYDRNCMEALRRGNLSMLFMQQNSMNY